jgi:hypothetical protein
MQGVGNPAYPFHAEFQVLRPRGAGRDAERGFPLTEDGILRELAGEEGKGFPQRRFYELNVESFGIPGFRDDFDNLHQMRLVYVLFPSRLIRLDGIHRAASNKTWRRSRFTGQ